MNKNLFIYIIFIGLIGLLSNCKKDETKVIILDNPIVPTLSTVPDLTLQRANGKDSLVFVGTPVDPGFKASATYYLEVDLAGNQFANPVVIMSGPQDLQFKIAVSDLNGIFISTFPSDVVTAIELRIRSVLTAVAITGVAPLVYISDSKPVSITTYGLPRLDLVVGTTVIGKIESALGDGKYIGYVKLDKTKTFTFKDPDANVVYGANSATKLVVNGTGITSSDNGYYKLTADSKSLTYSIDPYFVGLIGDATANGWNSPDTKMDYDSKTGNWFVTTDLKTGNIKFRLNDAWDVNWGGNGSANGSADNYTDASTVPLKAGAKDIPILGGAGNYTIKLNITALKATVVKN